MFDAFLSYARADDKAFVAGLYARLTAAGFRIWFDEQEMPSRGETFLREIQHAIDESERLIAVVGPAALASDYVRAEWDYAQLFSKAVVPVLRSGSSADDIPSELRGEGYALVPEELRHYHCPDFRAERNQEEAFRELERILKQPVTAPGEAYHVPPLPVHFLPRRELLREIAETLLVDAFHPVTVKEAAKQTTLLHGLPGAGKSVLASAFARDVSIRRSFRDGVIWLTVTPTPDLLRQWRRIGKALKDAGTHYADLDAAEDRLQEVLKDRECLIVMDDVWEKRHVEPVYNALGGRCRLLLTAREKGIGRSFGAAHCEAAVLSPHEALSLLSQRSEVPVEHLARDAEGVARACGYLPLALAMSGAMVKAGIRWKTLLDALAKADLSFLGHELANYPHPHVMRALQVSVDFMKASNPDAPARYHDLAVFLDARQVPESVVLRLWCHEGLDPARAEKLLTDFDSASLLRLTDDRRVELHDLQWDYVRSHTPDAVVVHRRLIAAYGEASAWPSMPDDGYFHARIVGHLLKAGLRPQVLSLVSRPWMQAQFRRTLNHSAFAADLDAIIEQLGTERPLDLVALIRACLVRATLAALSTRIPPAALAALARCGEMEQAVGFAALIVEPENRADAFKGIAEAAHAAGDVPAARRHLTSALLAALRIEDPDEPDGAIRRILGTWTEWFGERDLESVSALASSDDDRDRLLQLIDDQRDAEPETDAADEEEKGQRAQAGPLVEARERSAALVEAGEFEAAARLVPQLPSYHRQKLFGELAPSLVRHGQYALAIETLGLLEYEHQREEMLVPLTSALLDAGAYAEAVRALETVGQYSRSKAADPMAVRLVDAGQHDLAWKVAQLVDSRGLETDIVVRMFRNAAASGRISHPREISTQPVPDHMKPDVLKALALVWAETGAHDLALASAVMTPERDRSEALKELALATAGAGDLRRARDLVPQMTRAWDRSDVLKAVAAAYLGAGRLEDAFEAARDMPPDKGIHESRSETLFSVLARALALGRLGEAADIAGSFGPASAKARAFAELARAHAVNGDLDRTRELLDDVLSLSLVVPANEDRDTTLGELGELLAAAGHAGPARALGDALADVPRAKVHGAIAVTEVTASPDRASELVDSLGALQTYGVRWVEADTWLALASACVEHHDVDRARAFALNGVDKAIGAYALQDAGMQVLFDSISPRLATAYRTLRKAETPRAAEAIFRGRRRLLKYKRNEILRALAVEEASSGIAADAVKLALDVRDPRTKVEALVAVAKSLVHRQDAAGALSAAQAALEASSKIKVKWQRTEAAGRAAAALIRAGDTKKWTRTLESALEGADSDVAARATSTVALALAESGHTMCAREWLDRLPADRPADVTGEVAIALHALGDVAAARTAAESLRRTAGSIPPEHDIRTTALLHAATVFTTLREPARAFQCLVECDLERDDVKDALALTIDLWRQTADPAADPDTLAKAWVSRSRSHGDAWQQCATLATVSAALARAGRADVGALTFARAMRDARGEGRDAIFAVLERGAPLLARLPDGPGLAEAVREIVEVEGWWQGTAG